MVRQKGWQRGRRGHLEKTELSAFQCEQLFFDWKTAAEAGQIAIAADDAVARNNDGNGIRTVCEAYCAGGVRAPDSPSQLAVADGFSVGNLAQIVPHKKLKLGAIEDERQVEIF